MTFLFDVNVLVALVDPLHISHHVAHQWFEREGHISWATCAVTENGLLRILSNPKYPNAFRSPAEALPTLASMRALPGHQFWNGTHSLCASPYVDAQLLTSHAQVTDTYLLALAVEKSGKLATLDRKLSPLAVKSGSAALHIIVG